MPRKDAANMMFQLEPDLRERWRERAKLVGRDEGPMLVRAMEWYLRLPPDFPPPPVAEGPPKGEVPSPPPEVPPPKKGRPAKPKPEGEADVPPKPRGRPKKAATPAEQPEPS